MKPIYLSVVIFFLLVIGLFSLVADAQQTAGQGCTEISNGSIIINSYFVFPGNIDPTVPRPGLPVPAPKRITLVTDIKGETLICRETAIGVNCKTVKLIFGE